MTAADIGLHGKPSRAIQRLMRMLDKPDAAGMQQRPTVCVRAPGLPSDQYGMFFGTAAIYQAITYCRDHIHSRGLKGEIGPGIALARFVVAIVRRDRRYINPLTLNIRFDENLEGSREYLLVMASTLQRLFLGIRPFWGTEPEPLQFTAIGAEPLRVLRALPLLLRGKSTAWMNNENGYTSRNVVQAAMDLDSGFTLDGELFTPEGKAGITTVSTSEPLRFVRT